MIMSKLIYFLGVLSSKLNKIYIFNAFCFLVFILIGVIIKRYVFDYFEINNLFFIGIYFLVYKYCLSILIKKLKKRLQNFLDIPDKYIYIGVEIKNCKYLYCVSNLNNDKLNKDIENFQVHYKNYLKLKKDRFIPKLKLYEFEKILILSNHRYCHLIKEYSKK